jgi:hypothetical protein
MLLSFILSSSAKTIVALRLPEGMQRTEGDAAGHHSESVNTGPGVGSVEAVPCETVVVEDAESEADRSYAESGNVRGSPARLHRRHEMKD